MTRWVVAAAVVLVAACGCTRFVDNPQARPASKAVGPISELQVRDLLSPNVGEGDGNLFMTVDPDRCSGLAREVDPPFIVEPGPVVQDGGHWQSEGAGDVYIEEIVAVYPANFDAAKALANARETIDSCREDSLSVTTMQGRTYVFGVQPRSDSGSESIVVWSLHASDWNCDNAFVAARNAAVEITTCGAIGGFDVGSEAKDALERIEKLANTTA